MVNIGALAVTDLVKLIHTDQAKEHLVNSMNTSGLCRPETDLCLRCSPRELILGTSIILLPKWTTSVCACVL